MHIILMSGTKWKTGNTESGYYLFSYTMKKAVCPIWWNFSVFNDILKVILFSERGLEGYAGRFFLDCTYA